MTSTDSRSDTTRPPTRSGASWRAGIGVLLASAIGVTALAGCGSSDSPEAATVPSSASSPAGTGTGSAAVTSAPTTSSSAASMPSQPAAQAVVTIDKFDYSVPISVSPGAMITVQNRDGEKHTVTADSADAFDVEVDGDGSTSFTAPTTPGSYPFHCIFHSNMTGVLVVK